jgi:hypothetical protein
LNSRPAKLESLNLDEAVLLDNFYGWLALEAVRLMLGGIAMLKAALVALTVFLAKVAAAQRLSAPPDVTASQAYPEDLVKGLSDDSAAQQCWNDEVDGSSYDWNKSGNPAIFKYTYKFRDTCNHPITCTLVIASGTILRDKATRHGSWRRYKSDRKSFTFCGSLEEQPCSSDYSLRRFWATS